MSDDETPPRRLSVGDGERHVGSDTILVSAGRDRIANIWDAASGEITHALKSSSGDTINAVAVSPDGSIVATAGADRTIRLWNPETGGLRHQLEGHKTAVLTLAYSPDGKLLASAGRDKHVILWRARVGKQARKIEAAAHGVINSVCFSPDSKTIASCGKDKRVRVWRVKTGRQERECIGHEDVVASVTYSPDGRCLASCGQDCAVLLWAPRSGEVIRRFTFGQEPVLNIAFSPNGSQLASAGADGVAIIWDVETGKAAGLLGHEGPVTCVSYSPDGHTLATGGQDGTVRIFDVESGTEVRCLEGHEDHVLCLAYGTRTKSGALNSGELLEGWNRDADSGSDSSSLASQGPARSVASSDSSRKSIASQRGATEGPRFSIESRKRGSGFLDLHERHGTIVPEYAIPEAIIPVPQESVGKVRATELHKLLNMSASKVPDSAWIPITDQDNIEEHSREDTRFMFYHQEHGVLFADDLYGLQSARVPTAITSGGFWLDVHTSSRDDLQVIAEVFGIHPLTLEDIYNGEEREKCEFYEGYSFISLRALSPYAVPSELTAYNVYFVVCGQYIITIHDTPEALATPQLLQRIAKMSKRMRVDSAWMLWTILDQTIDQYIPIVSAFEEECESIDDLVLSIAKDETSDMLRRIWEARKNVAALQRLLAVKTIVLRNLINSKERANAFAIPADALLYLNDILDHVQTMETTLNVLADTLNRSQGNYLATVGIELTQGANETNDIMKRLTSIAGVMMPLTLISGIWGMNSAVPGVNEVLPFWYIIIGMVLLAIVIVYIFWKYHFF